jgi:hypothetical protein
LLHKFTNNSPGSFLPVEKMHKESIWKGKIYNNFSGIFREGSEAWIFLSGSWSLLWTLEHKLENEREAYLRKMHVGGQIKGPGRPDQAGRPGVPTAPIALALLPLAPCCIMSCPHAPRESITQILSATLLFLNDEINASLLNFVSLLVFHGLCAFTYFLQNKVMFPSPMLVLYMCPKCFDDKAFSWCIIDHKLLNKPQNLPLIMLDAKYSSNFGN